MSETRWVIIPKQNAVYGIDLPENAGDNPVSKANKIIIALDDELAQLRAEIVNLKERGEVYKGAKEVIAQLRASLAAAQAQVESARKFIRMFADESDYQKSTLAEAAAWLSANPPSLENGEGKSAMKIVKVDGEDYAIP